MENSESSDEKLGDNGSNFEGGVTLCHDEASNLQKKLEEQYNNISLGQTENHIIYSTDAPCTSQDETHCLSSQKRFQDQFAKESYANDGESPNFVDNFIKGEQFDEQIAKFCDGQALPSLRIGHQTSSTAKDNKSVRFDMRSNKLLVKDEFLAAVRDDLADDYSSLYKETPSRITEAGRKYLAERATSASDADSRLLEDINNSKLSQEIRIKFGSSNDSRQIMVSSSQSDSTTSIGVQYQYPFIPSLLADNLEETPSDNSSFLQSVSMAAIESGGKNSNKKVRLNFCIKSFWLN